MPVKSLDRRAKMTRKILKQSLIELMKKKPIHEISIKKICETADINRSTFYHHYESQFELFDEILNDIGIDIYEMVKKHSSSPDWMTLILEDAFTYIEDHRETFLVILSENSGFSVGENLTQYVERFVNTTSEDSSEISKYCAQFATAGMTSVIWKWLNTEDRMSAKDLARMISTLLAPSLARFTLFPIQ
jgi:AcrR family transcriptional regulator